MHRQFDRDAILLGNRGQADHVRMQRGLELGQMLHERGDATLVGETVLPPLPALVLQIDGDAGVEEGQFTQALGQHVVVELGLAEGFRAGQEAYGGAASGGVAHHLHRVLGLAQLVFLDVLLAFAIDGQPQVRAERVDHRYAHTMQATRHLVGVVVELAARVQHGHHHFGSGTTFLRMHVDRDAAAVVAHAHRAIVMDGDDYMIAITGQSFVDRIVDDFEHHVVETGAVVGITDVHARALAYRFEALEYLDVARIVGRVHSVAGLRRRNPSGMAP